MERGSTIVTSNLPFEEWTSVFGSQRLTGALLDRLTHHVPILELNGESYRLKQSKARRRRDPQALDWAATQLDASAGATGVSLGQRQGSASVWLGFRPVDAARGCGPDRAEIRHSARSDGCRRIARQARPDAAKASATRLSTRPGGDREMAPRDLSGHRLGGERGWGRSLFLGRIGVSRRYRARQDLG